jgi:hypothetical protein
MRKSSITLCRSCAAMVVLRAVSIARSPIWSTVSDVARANAMTITAIDSSKIVNPRWRRRRWGGVVEFIARLS